jgi:hypothetical protein
LLPSKVIMRDMPSRFKTIGKNHPFLTFSLFLQYIENLLITQIGIIQLYMTINQLNLFYLILIQFEFFNSKFRIHQYNLLLSFTPNLIQTKFQILYFGASYNLFNAFIFLW